MALGPGIFKEKYKDYSLEQLNNELDKLKKYLVSDELKQARQEEINEGIDDNNCITNVESNIEALETLIKEKENTSNKNGFIRKTILDENGVEYEVEEQFALPDFEQIKWLGKIAEKLQINLDDLSTNSKRLDDVKATYYWNSSRGGTSLIVSDDGSYLGATSAVNFDRHLEEFKSGKRNGNFNEVKYEEKEKNVLKSIIEKIISDYQEFSMKPPVYDIPSKFFLVEKDNQYYLSTILDKHIMHYPNKQNDDTENQNYPMNLLIYNLYDNESEILTYEEFCKKYSFKITNINVPEILKTKANYTAIEIIRIKRSLPNILEDILQNKETVNLEKYENEYLPKFLLSLTEPEIKLLLNSPLKESNDKILKINCHSCNNEIVIDCSKLPTNIKTLDTMCPNCKSFIKYANLNYVEETKKEYTQDDYKHFFYRQMTEDEKEKLNALNCNDKISKLITSNYQIKYLNDIGYLFIGEGYLILENGTEPTHYFAKIFKTKEEAINEIEQNYSEKFNDNENETITISAIEKTGIPTKQFENTILFVSSDNAVIDNKKVLIDDKKFNFIINIIDQKLNKIKEIKNQQTPEFLNNHLSYDNKSKIFSIKYNNEEISINYHTGTESDKYIIELINLIIDILMKDNKEIENELNSAFEQDLNNINSMLKDVENMIFGENKNFSLAKEKLLDFVKGISIFENDNETDYYNFDDVIQFVIYTRLNKTNKKIVWSSIPFLTAYSYLAYIYNEEKNYEEALNIIDKQMKIAPLNLSGYFEKCETYKMQKMWEQFKEETQKIYEKIYDAKDLAHLYRNLGFYYIEQNKFDLAYALYTASIQFEKHRLAYSEIMYINQQLGRENYSMSAEETLKLLDDNNIPFGVKKENIDLLISIYENEKELIKNPSTEMLLAEKIYYLTKDKRFAPFFEKIDITTGCSIVIPRSWNPIKPEVIKEKFSKNQMFAIYTDTNALFQAVYDGKCAEKNFNEAYNLNVSNIKNNKQFNTKLLKESIIDLKLQQGLKRFNQVLFEIITNENKKIYLYHNFTLINGIFVDFSIDVDSNIDYNDDSKFNNQKNVLDLIDVLSSIIEIKNNNTQDTLKLNNIEEKINQACVLYKSNKDINVIVDIAKDIINSKTDDIFWIVASRDAFIYLILKQFNDKNDCNYMELIKIISDKNLFIKSCKESTGNDVGDLGNYADKVRKSSDKMLDSYYEIICSSLNVKTETSTNNSELNKLIEDTIIDEDISLKETVLNIIKLIISLRPETTTKIAELIKYEPEKNFVEPLTQGKVFNYVFDVCKKMNINLEEVDESFGGLAYYYTFKKTDKKENNNDELIEHTINSNISFKFKLPKLYGEITKKTDISFKVGNSINVMIAKCSDISKLYDRSLQWLENSAKTNNQNILKDKVRKYFLNNETIQVIERMVEKDNQRRMYKFIYLNESMIIFAFGTKGYNEKFENTINNAIISIKEIGNQKKVERDPFEKVNNSNVLNENVKKYMNDFVDNEIEQPSNIDSEFLEYSKLYKEKFGKNAYIAMPDGTKEQTINAIKECLKRNEDVLDKILYPTFEKDTEDGVLY